MSGNRADLLFPFTFMIILSEHMFVNPYFSFSRKYLQKSSQSYTPVHCESYRPIQINHAYHAVHFCFLRTYTERMQIRWSIQWLRWQKHTIWIFTDILNFCWSIVREKYDRWTASRTGTLEWKSPIYQKSHMNYSELLQLAKGWSNFKFERIIIWQLLSKQQWLISAKTHEPFTLSSNPILNCLTQSRISKCSSRSPWNTHGEYGKTE